MSRLKIKPRKFKAKSADIPNLADAVFEGDHEMPDGSSWPSTQRAANVSKLFSRTRISPGAMRGRAFRPIG